jgi:hypothetical protein
VGLAVDGLGLWPPGLGLDRSGRITHGRKGELLDGASAVGSCARGCGSCPGRCLEAALAGSDVGRGSGRARSGVTDAEAGSDGSAAIAALGGGAVGGGRGTQINEALALVQLGELNAAEAMLSALELAGLSAMERTMVCLGRFEVHARRGRVAEAMQMYRAIEGRFLMPVQSRWLETEYHRLRTVQDANRDQPRFRTP